MWLKLKSKKDNKHPKESLTDEDLIRLYAKTADKELVGELFERYTHLVFGLCMKYLKNADDSQDAVMQIFESLLAKLLHHEVVNFKTWIYSVAKNHCLMQLRQAKPQDTIDEFSEKKTDLLVELPEELHLTNNHTPEQIVAAALQQLDEHQQRCLDLFYLQDKSYNEVQQITGYTYNEVKSYIQNGKKQLKKHLRRDE